MGQISSRIAISLCFLYATVTACTGVRVPAAPVWEEVPITDIKHVAGKWEGITWAEPRQARQEDWVEVKILEEGQYEFFSRRMIGTWIGGGNLILDEGKLVTLSKPDEGSATFTLYENNGARMLKVQGKTKNDRRHEAKLNPAKK